jgi:hypothetical protein
VKTAIVFIVVLFAVGSTAHGQVLGQANTTKPGAILEPRTVSVPAALRDKLSSAADIRAFVTLENSDEVIVYDTVHDAPDTADFMDNRPHIAVMRHGAVLFNTDVVNLESSGPVRFEALAVLPGPEDSAVAAFAFSLGVNGAGKSFVFIGRTPTRYKVTGVLNGEQAQLRFDSHGRLRFWSADGWVGRGFENECVWCPKYYKESELAWTAGKLHRLNSVRHRESYDPSTFAEEPFKFIR